MSALLRDYPACGIYELPVYYIGRPAHRESRNPRGLIGA